MRHRQMRHRASRAVGPPSFLERVETMPTTRLRIVLRKGFALLSAWALAFSAVPVTAQVVTTPTVPLELPVEVELELAPGSLKQAPLWHEIAELLDNPSAIQCLTPDDPATRTSDESAECVATTPRRPSFRFDPI